MICRFLRVKPRGRTKAVVAGAEIKTHPVWRLERWWGRYEMISFPHIYYYCQSLLSSPLLSSRLAGKYFTKLQPGLEVECLAGWQDNQPADLEQKTGKILQFNVQVSRSSGRPGKYNCLDYPRRYKRERERANVAQNTCWLSLDI